MSASADRRAHAAENLRKAAMLVVDEGKTREAARQRFRVGSTELGRAIAALRAERAGSKL